MTEIRLAIPLTPINPFKYPYLSLKVDDFPTNLEVGQEFEIRKAQISDLIDIVFRVMVISCHQGYVFVRPQSLDILNKAIEIYKVLNPGEYRLLNSEEYQSLYPLPEGF
jgi:hypothetical protein